MSRPNFSSLLEAEIERFDEEQGDDVADRRWGLFHREPHVRVAAIRSMATTVADPHVQCLLLRMMGESLMLEHIFHCPCVEAALVLREAPRGEFFAAHIQPELLRRIESNNQAVAGAAACALRPGEADLRKLARSIAMLARAGVRPRAVIAELRSYPGGAEALARAMPRSEVTVNGAPVDALEGAWPIKPHQPVRRISGFVQECILEGTGYRFKDLGERARSTTLELAGAWRGAPHLALLCRLAIEEPQYLASVLRRGPYVYFTPDGQEHLHDALLVYEDLRLALLEWPALRPRGFSYEFFPFRAIEGLVLRGDERFVKLFSEQIGHAIGVAHPRPLDPRLFTVPQVLDAAMAFARQLVGQVDDGFDDATGRTGRLAASSAGRYLGAMRQAWIHRPGERVAASVRAWLNHDDVDYIRAALLALGPGLDDDGQARIVEIVEMELDHWHAEVQVAAIEFAFRGGFIAKLHEPLLRIAKTPRHPLQPAAIAALTAFLPSAATTPDDELEAAAGEIVAGFPADWYPPHYIGHEWVLPSLVQPRWQAWVARLANHCERSLMELATLRILTPLFPSEGQSFVMSFVSRVLGHFVLPWVQDLEDLQPRRIGDEYQELLYRLGVDAEGMASGE